MGSYKNCINSIFKRLDWVTFSFLFSLGNASEILSRGLSALDHGTRIMRKLHLVFDLTGCDY